MHNSNLVRKINVVEEYFIEIVLKKYENLV